MNDAAGKMTLLDWKRRVFELYAEVRASSDPISAWNRWRAVRDDLFGSHPQSPIPESRRSSFAGLAYFDYDPEMRVTVEARPTEPQRFDIPTSGDESMTFTQIAEAVFTLRDEEVALGMYWLEGYGGGLFVPFRDVTSGSTSYGAGRYLLDTIKGSDLGTEDDKLVLDFNFAYNPSCAYDPRWLCPLAPPANRLEVAVEAGERAP